MKSLLEKVMQTHPGIVRGNFCGSAYTNHTPKDVVVLWKQDK